MSNGVITPEEIRAKAKRMYPRYLDAWLRSEADGFFPRSVATRLKVSLERLAETSREVAVLKAASKELRRVGHTETVRGVGYTVHLERVRSPKSGSNELPRRLTIDTAEDLFALCERAEHFDRTAAVARRVRAELPGLEDWLRRNVRKLAEYAEPLDALIAVTRYFLEHPRPDCFARQLPVAEVDTKFVENNKTVLRQWLDELLPPSAIRADEQDFFRRFGLRDGEPHWAIRALDPQLQYELGLPFEALSLPMRFLAQLTVRDATVVIVENRTNLMTLPAVERGLGMCGEGNAVARFRELDWLRENRIVYWGDIDVEGFRILSSLRSVFPDVHSLLMDATTLETHRQFAVSGNHTRPDRPAHLTAAEAEAFDRCRAADRRLEQEKIPQPAVEAAFAEFRVSRRPSSYDRS